MKYASNVKVAGFLDRLFGRDPEPDRSDRARGMSLVGGLGIAGLLGAGAVSGPLSKTPVSGLEDSDRVMDSALDKMRNEMSMSAKINTWPTDDIEAGLGDPAGSVYSPKRNEIYRSVETPRHLLLHEGGHASNRSTLPARAIGALNAGRRTPLLGLGVALGAGGTGNETLETWAPAAVAATHTPQLLEEGRAWLNADRALSSAASAHAENPSSIMRNFRRRGLGSLAGYGLAAGVNVGAAHKLPDVIDWFSER